MNETIKTCIYSGYLEEDYCLTLRNGLALNQAIRVVTEAHDAESLEDCLKRLPIGLLVIDLDPKPKEPLRIMEHVSVAYPSLAIIALSEKSDPELILSAMRCGCRQFITKPIDQADLNKALKPLARQASGQVKTERVICLVGSSGGCGVTTIAANLAIELAQLGTEPCALVDLQMEFGSLATYFDVRPTHTIADLVSASGEIDTQMVEQAMNVMPSRVALLARPERVEQATNVNPERVARVLKILASKYDSVVVDTPNRFDSVAIAALEMATSVMIVLQLSVPSIRNAERLHKTLTQYGMPMDKISFVANRFVHNSPLSLQDVEEHIGAAVFTNIPNDFQTVQAALNFGRPLLSESPASPVRKAIAEMAGRIYRGEFVATSAKNKPKPGFFSRWHSK